MKVLKHLFILILFLIGITSCDTFKDKVSADDYEEVPKDLDGIWQLSSVSRNGTDITTAMDFSRFLLYLNKDSTYRMDNYLPFVAKGNGTWKVDDPKYPFHLIFKEEGNEEGKTVEIGYSIVEGERQISMKLSPGCAGNVYVYVFKRVIE